MNERQLIEALTRTIATDAGFFNPGPMNIAARLNNPCLLPHFCDKEGNPYPEEMGLVAFPNLRQGWRAARIQARINVIKRRLTFAEFFGGKPGVYRGLCPGGVDPMRAARSAANALRADDIHTVIASLVVEDSA